MRTLRPIAARRYGTRGPWAVAIHGGPGAPGHMAPIAAHLADTHRVLEPLQRLSGGGVSLTVAQHIADMAECIATHCGDHGDEMPALIGCSWGAMLALAYAAAHPPISGPVVLIGSGTFTIESRAEFKRLLAARLDGDLQARIDALATTHTDPDARLAAKAEIISLAYQGSPADPDTDTLHVDAVGNREAWDDMLRLQADGTFPAAFAAIASRVLMIHGNHDPHPGAMIRDSLLPYIPHLEYHELAGCGHDPWREPKHRAEFYRVLDRWLARG